MKDELALPVLIKFLTGRVNKPGDHYTVSCPSSYVDCSLETGSQTI